MATRLPGIDETALVKELQEKRVKLTAFFETANLSLTPLPGER